MLEIKITLDATPALAALLKGLASATPAARAAANPQPGADLAPAPAQPGSVIPFPAAPAAPAPAPQPAPITPQAAAPVVPVAAAPSFTKEQIARAGSELISQQPGRMQELMGLLASYGVQAITDLKPEQLGPFATTLRGMGAKL